VKMEVLAGVGGFASAAEITLSPTPVDTTTPPTPGIVSVWAEQNGRAVVWRRIAETGELLLVDLSDARTRALYEARAKERVEKREKIFRKLSLDAVRVRPGDDYVAPLAALFRARSRRRSA